MSASAQHSHRGLHAVTHLLEHAPGTGGLALWMAHRDLDDDPERGVALVQTDGRTLFYAPAFEDLPLERQVGWVAHVMLHVALRHVARREALRALRGDVDDTLFNLCADAVVNSTLAHVDWLELPDGALRLPALLAEVLRRPEEARDEAAALQAWDVERLYDAVDDRGRSGGRKVRSEKSTADRMRQLGRQQTADLRAGAGEEAPEERAASAQQWQERLLRAHAADGAFSLLRALPGEVPRSRTPWALWLRARLSRVLAWRVTPSASRPSRSWLATQGRMGPHRRRPWEPGHTHARAVPRLVLVVDVSGSIDDGLLQRFAGEVAAIARRHAAPWVLVVGDDAVRRVVQVPGDAPASLPLGALAGVGSGDTDFTPLLEEADRHKPDLIVVLTDLDGPARHRPRAPVLWAVPAEQANAARPFGRQLVLG